MHSEHKFLIMLKLSFETMKPADHDPHCFHPYDESMKLQCWVYWKSENNLKVLSVCTGLEST